MASNLKSLLDDPTRYLFFTGKGGVGKTSLAAATAVALADSGRRILLVSTDPASNLSEVLGTELGPTPRPVQAVQGLWALDIDPVAAARAYRDRVVGPYKGVLPDTVLAGIEEQLSGACTVEIAAFDEFTGFLATDSDYDHIVFDTAPTGHTLRLLALPGSWTDYLDTNSVGITCVGPLSGLTNQRAQYKAALSVLSQSSLTTLVLVTRLDSSSVLEAERASHELSDLGLTNQHLLINGVFASDSSDALAQGLTVRQRSILDALPETIAALPRDQIRLSATPPIGISGVRSLLGERKDRDKHWASHRGSLPVTADLSAVVERIAEKGRGLVMTVGKGGVGKTTVAASIAIAVAEKGVPVVLSTTDPAAHLMGVLGDGDLPSGIVVERIDPEAATVAYKSRVLSTVGAGLSAEGTAVLEEDLRSPCTEEIAVFGAFAETVARAKESVVVLDTAPSGHTLLLLDAARSYQREMKRQAAGVQSEVEELLDHLTDPDYTSIFVITLPQATPVHEAVALQDDLRRAGIEPTTWIVNQSIYASGSNDVVLMALGEQELRWIAESESASNGPLVLLPMKSVQPIGVDALLELVGSPFELAKLANE